MHFIQLPVLSIAKIFGGSVEFWTADNTPQHSRPCILRIPTSSSSQPFRVIATIAIIYPHVVTLLEYTTQAQRHKITRLIVEAITACQQV